MENVKAYNEKEDQKNFLKGVNELLEKYHAGIYLIDGVFEGAVMMLESIKTWQKEEELKPYLKS
jgi:hypothetical protein